jgi:hypothetical protein
MKALVKTASGLVILTAAAGTALILFNILDFSIEKTRLYPPSVILYTLPIAAAALGAAFAAAKAFSVTNSKQILWLGCGALAFGLGNLIASWGGEDVNTAVAIKDSANFLASILFLVGVSLSLFKQRKESIARPGLKTPLLLYLGVIICMAVIAILVYQSVIPPFHIPGKGATALNSTIQWLSVVLSFVSVIICLRIYFISRRYSIYWQLLGLALFTLAIFFGSQSSVDSLLSWLGRISLFLAGIYMLIAAIFLVRQDSQKSRT